ncbi:hypothetical protein CKF54_06430 [Psittacicella hinzii]|uniref:Mechanosensitive channel MscK n=1 Tax=Psittacicella hinzii TaxID=2028575 RepID=A0A3A1Y2B0_9GAMM|nr:mechanosensitive ion channel domain-containing protein [Psittacicella hinzii]RIY31550.1 hypothetical protein CKF54_06430 [Psittacicella hinzii]
MSKIKLLTSLGLGAGLALALTNSPQLAVKALNFAVPSTQAATQANLQVESLNNKLINLNQQLNILKAQTNPDTTTQNAITQLTQAIDYTNKAIAALQNLASLTAKVNEITQAKDQLAQQITSLQSQVDNYDQASLNLDKLSVAQLQAQIQVINDNLTKLDAQEAEIIPVSTNANVEVIQNNNRLQEITATLSESSNLAIQQISNLQAEADYLTASNSLANYYISQQTTLTNYNDLLKQKYSLEEKLYNLQLTSYTAAYNRTLESQVAGKENQFKDSPVLLQQAQANRKLVDNLDELNSFITYINQVNQERSGQLDIAQQVSRTISTQIEVLKGTLELNVLINQQKSFLPDVGEITSFSNKINSLQVTNFQLLAEQQLLANPNTYIANLEKSNNITFNAEETAALKEILSQRSSLIEENLKLLNQAIVETTGVDNLQNKLLATIQGIDNQLNQQDFFVRSTPPVNANWLKTYWYGAKNQIENVKAQFTITVGSLLFYFLGALFILLGYAIHKQTNRIVAHLEVLRNRVNNREKDGFIVTPLAILLTLLTNIYRSFIWGGAVLILFNTIFKDTSYVIDYFGYTFIFLMFLSFTINLLRSGGVLNTHYSPKGSFYAKIENNDLHLLEDSLHLPQPRVKFVPARIFASSKVAATTKKRFGQERLDFLAEIERHKGLISHETQPLVGEDNNLVCWESVRVIDPEARKEKVIEADKYMDLPESPVKQLFMKTAVFNQTLRNFLNETAVMIFIFVNIMYFNVHPTVTPSENILGQTAYVVALIYTLVALTRYTRRMNQSYRLSHGYLDLKYKVAVGLVWLLPLLLLVMVLNGYVNTTTVILQHILHSYYGIVIIILVTRLLQRELAVFNLINSRRAQPEPKVIADDLDDVQYKSAVTSGNIFVQQRERALALFNAQRQAYFDQFVDYLRLSNLIAWTFGLIVFYVVWSDLVSVVNYLDKVTIWQVAGTVAGTVQNITLLNFFKAIVSILVTYFIWKNLKTLLDIFVFSKIRFADGLPYAIQTISAYILFAIGFSVAVGTLGLNWSKLQWLLSALLVGLGFGLQEIFTNFVAGFIILFERPIRIGDYVTIAGNSGSIKSIRIRATTITDADNKEIVIPNKTFVTSSFTNWTLSESRTRLVLNIGVAYGSDVDLVTETLLEAANLSPKVFKDKYPPTCYFSDFGASTLNFILRCHVPELGDRVPTTHDINRTINRLCQERGIEIAFNQLDVYIKNGSGVDVKVESVDLNRLSSPKA